MKWIANIHFTCRYECSKLCNGITSRQDEEGIVCKTKIDVCVGTGFGYSCKRDKYDPTYLYTLPSKQTAAGAWSVHPIEHVISAYYDITHGVGLAVLTPAWMSYVLSDTTAPRLARFAREVFGVEEADNRKAAELGIQKVRAFNQSLGMPATLSEAGVPEDLFDEMASEAVRTSTIASKVYVKLESSDVKQILLSCR